MGSESSSSVSVGISHRPGLGKVRPSLSWAWDKLETDLTPDVASVSNVVTQQEKHADGLENSEGQTWSKVVKHIVENFDKIPISQAEGLENCKRPCHDESQSLHFS